jgi:soluble lytic murein transglycosylase
VQRHLTGQLADRLGHPDWGVSLAREAARDGIPLLTFGYPLPSYQVPTQPERAFVLGIARQESNFDPNAQSVAGALGLMQLMPATAKSLARQGHITYTQSKLTSDPAYNLRLGSAFLGSLVNNYDGSYVLAAVAYNAGPGRVRQWTHQFGDPRDGQTDAVDWIEEIPFAETRAYVQRVMENVMIYRARLGQTRVIGSTLETELVRARPAG